MSACLNLLAVLLFILLLLMQDADGFLCCQGTLWLMYSCCLPGPSPQRCSPDSQATGNCCQQHNCCDVGREEHGFFLKEENPSRRKVFPSRRTLLCPLRTYNTMSWSAHSLSFCSSGPVLEYTNCSSWFNVICTLDSAACCLFHDIDQTRS